MNKVMNNEDLLQQIFSFVSIYDQHNIRLVSCLFNKNINKTRLIIAYFSRNIKNMELQNTKEYEYSTLSANINTLTGYPDEYLVHCKFKYSNYFIPCCSHSLKYCINNDCYTKSPVVGNIYLQYTTNNNDNEQYEYYHLTGESTEFNIYNLSNPNYLTNPVYSRKFIPIIQRFIPYCFECMLCYS